MDTPSQKPVGLQPRPTEGFQRGAVSFEHRLNEQRAERKRGGRPLGSKNKPRGLIPKELASEFLGIIKDMVPTEYYEEMRGAIREGKAISTLTEAKITLKLMGPPIWRRLISEGKPIDETKPIEFSRDLNERLKVYTGLMAFIEKVEDEQEPDNSKKPIFEIFAGRGVDAGRVKFLLGYESGAVGGDSDEVGGETLVARTVSGELPERQGDVQDSQ